METPFKDLLFTNAVPSDADCQRIRDLLVGPQAEVAKIAGEIHRLETLVNELAVKRDRLSAFIDAHLALVSPVRRLPEDVLAEIFVASLPSDRNALISNAESPLVLCRVSRAWKGLARSTPRLWASLHIVDRRTQRRHLCDAVQLWLSRSGALPLSISLVSSHDTPTDVSMLLGTLIPYSPRWKRMRFKLWSYLSAQPLALLSTADLPILETIILDFDKEPTGGLGWNIDALFQAPALRSVASLTGIPSPSPFSRLRHLWYGRAPGPTLTQARTYISSGAMLDILRACPFLATCVVPIANTHGDRNQDPPPSPCRMDHLSQLSVIDYWDDADDFFTHLEVPRLESLEYEGSQLRTTAFPFTPLLTPNNTLQRLALNVPTSSAFLLDCLRLVPALRELCIHQRYLRRGERAPPFDAVHTTKLWSELMLIPTRLPPVCPHLRRVTFTRFRGLTDATVLNFLQLRAPRIEYARFEFDRAMQEDIVPLLQPEVAAGLVLDLRYVPPPPPPVYAPGEGNIAYTERGLSDRWT
ncbi:hypothetical protein C8R46DRAFT_281961 [Mycena filopes]|nr:hypothetical protein C8R46DRAFT_281961 [Mycena filopes]